jgi:hypothetical protein
VEKAYVDDLETPLEQLFRVVRKMARNAAD